MLLEKGSDQRRVEDLAHRLEGVAVAAQPADVADAALEVLAPGAGLDEFGGELRKLLGRERLAVGFDQPIGFALGSDLLLLGAQLDLQLTEPAFEER